MQTITPQPTDTVTVNNQGCGKPLKLDVPAKAKISFNISWTFPLNFAEIVSGDGKATFRHKIDLTNTRAYGQQTFSRELDLTGRKWVRLEVWDAAVNGAFTQTIWLE